MTAHTRRLEARIALEGNPVFTDLRMERDALLHQLACLLAELDAANRANHDQKGVEP